MMSWMKKIVVSVAVSVGGTVAFGSPVSVDGILGVEWTGVPSVTVTHDAGALTGNFGAPSNTTALLTFW